MQLVSVLIELIDNMKCIEVILLCVSKQSSKLVESLKVQSRSHYTHTHKTYKYFFCLWLAAKQLHWTGKRAKKRNQNSLMLIKPKITGVQFLLLLLLIFLLLLFYFYSQLPIICSFESRSMDKKVQIRT